MPSLVSTAKYSYKFVFLCGRQVSLSREDGRGGQPEPALLRCESSHRAVPCGDRFIAVRGPLECSARTAFLLCKAAAVPREDRSRAVRVLLVCRAGTALVLCVGRKCRARWLVCRAGTIFVC